MKVVAATRTWALAVPMNPETVGKAQAMHGTIGESWPNHNWMCEAFAWVEWDFSKGNPMLVRAADIRPYRWEGDTPERGVYERSAPLLLQNLARDYGRVMTKHDIVPGKRHNYWGMLGTIPQGTFGVVIRDEVFSSSEKFLANLFCVFDGFPQIVMLREYDVYIPEFEGT